MVDFKRDVLEPSAAAEAFIAETGGLPEISHAAADLQAAIGKTLEEIDGANFASRFPRTASQHFNAMAEGRMSISPEARAAIAEEGEAGFKRTQLRADLRDTEARLHSLIHRLVEIRTDLEVSQREF